MQCTSTFANLDDENILVGASSCGDRATDHYGPHLWDVLKKAFWNTRSHPEDLNVIQIASVQDLLTTASTEWARRAHSVLVRPACVHQGKGHNPTLSFEWAGGPHHSLMRFPYVYHVQIRNQTAYTA